MSICLYIVLGGKYLILYFCGKENRIMRSNTMSAILEGLCSINEASVFNSKLNSFLIKGKVSDENQKLIKKALNDLFLGIKKDQDGYIEGKRPTIKDEGFYSVITMKIQSNKFDKSINSFYDKVKYWDGPYDRTYVDGKGYTCIGIDLDKDGSLLNGKDIIIGVSEIGQPRSYANKYRYQDRPEDEYGGEYIDKSHRGATYRVVVSIPNPDYVEKTYHNPCMTKLKDNVYTFTSKNGNETLRVNFDLNKNKVDIKCSYDGEYDTYNVIYKSSSKVVKAFEYMVDNFTSKTGSDDAKKMIEGCGVTMVHSYWFNPYTD